MREYSYLLAKNPIFFDRITENQYFAFKQAFALLGKSIEALAPYDEEIKLIADYFNQFSEEELNERYEQCSTFEKAKETYRTGKIDFVSMRNALLQ